VYSLSKIKIKKDLEGYIGIPEGYCKDWKGDTLSKHIPKSKAANGEISSISRFDTKKISPITSDPFSQTNFGARQS
jgi:hypothetical protein